MPTLNTGDQLEGMDYSDFEYQQITARNGVEPTDSNAAQTVLVEYEPLDDIGGLSNNEVAELVYAEVISSLEVDDEGADQNVATFYESRGVFGANFPSNGEFLPATIRNGIEGEVLEGKNNFDLASVGSSESEDRIFQMFRNSLTAPFDDETTGPGGGGAAEDFHAEKNWRSLTGRGPVLDANDKLGIMNKIICGDSVISFENNVRVHLVWDVAEVSDAGREFSVPM